MHLLRRIRMKDVAVFLLVLMAFPLCVCSAENTITIKVDSSKGEVNRAVFGNNIIAYDPTTYQDSTKEYRGYSDYGAGLWDPEENEPVGRVVDLARAINIPFLRFPGGCGTHHYVWQETIGTDRTSFLFGIDEFFTACAAIGAEPIITISYFTGDEYDAADLIAYLNGEADQALISELEEDRLKRTAKKVINKVMPFLLLHFAQKKYNELYNRYVMDEDDEMNWPNYRALNGHIAPYGIKYVEIGNEVYHGNHRDVERVRPEDYAAAYLRYYHKIKEVDPAVTIGAVLHTPYWNERLASVVKDTVDFGVLHIYPTPSWNSDLSTMPVEHIFGLSLALPEMYYGPLLREAADTLQRYAKKPIPLAITEMNCGFVQEKPVPYRHTLGCALVNAELLQLFMQPEYNIVMANYWNFNNAYTGMIANDFGRDYESLRKRYFKRPNYYVYALYADHFGDILVESAVEGASYDVLAYKDNYVEDEILLTGETDTHNLLTDIPWHSEALSGVDVSVNPDDVAITFVKPAEGNYYHVFKICPIKPHTLYMVSGYIKTENLVDDTGVCIEVQDARGYTRTHFAKSTKRITGTSDWTYVERIVEPLSDAQSLKVILRRNATTLNVTGTALFKDVSLREYTPHTAIPLLSVNASRNREGTTVYVMVVNKSLDTALPATLVLRDFKARRGEAWVLTGDRIDATNEDDHSTVTIHKKDVAVSEDGIRYTFLPHSLTAIELEGTQL